MKSFFRKESLRALVGILLLLTLLFVMLHPFPFHETLSANSTPQQDFIKWVDFSVPYTVMKQALQYDIESHTKGQPISWITLLSYAAAKTGGNINEKNGRAHVQDCWQALQSGKSIDELTQNLTHFSYYLEAYGAVLDGLVGTRADGSYGVCAYSPVAKGYYYSHYDDFGAARSYGYKRRHLGNDLLGSVGTPIVAVEDGVVEALGWNQYGGWRIGIRSLDTKRYYYYAHLRKNHPYVETLREGDEVKAGDVIGYLGMTGYSTTENVNNITTPHLHFGIQLIFDESQKEGNGEIWIDVYDIIRLLEPYRSAVEKDAQSGDFHRITS